MTAAKPHPAFSIPNLLRHWLAAVLTCFALAGNAWAAVVDVNTADESQLRTVKGIGPVKAKALLAYRAKNGPFRSASDLRKVKGFGAKTLARIGPSLSISGKPISSGPPVAATSAPASARR
jgi:competence protein ComEA